MGKTIREIVREELQSALKGQALSDVRPADTAEGSGISAEDKSAAQLPSGAGKANNRSERKPKDKLVLEDVTPPKPAEDYGCAHCKQAVEFGAPNCLNCNAELEWE